MKSKGKKLSATKKIAAKARPSRSSARPGHARDGAVASKSKLPAPADKQLGLARSSSVLEKMDASQQIAALERVLGAARDHLQAIQESQQATNDALQAANSKLTTVNEKMAGRNDELNRLYSDLTNLQTCANLGVILLGRDLTIRRFTVQAEKHFHLTASDLGRPMSAITHDLHLPGLDRIIKKVINGVKEIEREVQASDGRWYSLRVRPYFTLDRKVDGAVLVLVDIDDLKKTEQLVTEAHAHATAIIRTVPNPLIILDAQLRLQSANASFYRTFRLTAAETKGRSIFELGDGFWNIPRLRHLLENILPQKSVFNDFEVTHDFSKLGQRTLLLNARMLVELGGKSKKILLGLQDITERKQVEEALAQAQVKLARYAGDLEGVVTKRTRQLTKSNRQLAAGVVSTRVNAEEYRKLYLQSQVTQKKLRHVTHQILTAQEDERKRISRELHDEVVQNLVAINVELSTLVFENSAGTRPLKDQIVRTQRLVEHSVDAVHRFARDLRPAVLDDLGLIPALDVFCKALAERKKFEIKLTASEEVEKLASNKRTVLYRVAQEALTNIARHARASKAGVTLGKIADTLRMEISDNGRSFPVAKVLEAKGRKRLGLVGMKERIEMIGGRLTIESTPGQGTIVRAEVPFTLDKVTP